MKTVLSRLRIATVAIVVCFLVSPITVFADMNDMDSIMTISPPTRRIVLVPGETYEGTVEVTNGVNSNKDLKYSVTIGSYGLGKDENGNVDYNNTDVDTVTEYNEIINWITLGKKEGVVSPNGTDTIPYTITVPDDAPFGGQYATIIVQNDTEDENTGNNVMIQNVIRFASSIIAEVAGETNRTGSIVENNIPSFILSSPLEVSSLVKNDGNVHTDATYTLQVWPIFSNEEICTNEESPESSFIMPGTQRYHAQKCEKMPPFGIFKVKQTVKIFDDTSVVERTVIVCPLWLLFIIIFAIVALVIWAVMKSRARKGRSKEQKKSSEE